MSILFICRINSQFSCFLQHTFKSTHYICFFLTIFPIYLKIYHSFITLFLFFPTSSFVYSIHQCFNQFCFPFKEPIYLAQPCPKSSFQNYSNHFFYFADDFRFCFKYLSVVTH